MRDDAVYLEYIIECIEMVEEYLGGTAARDEELFLGDLRTQDAVLRRMEILADAASHLSSELRARHPDVDWRKAIDFRNVLAHAYMEIQLSLVWETITDDLPLLKAVAQEELGQLDGSD